MRPLLLLVALLLASCGDDEIRDAAIDAGLDAPGLDARVGPQPATLACELLADDAGPAPAILVAGFEAPARHPTSGPCPEESVEVSGDGHRLYYHFSTNRPDVLAAEGRRATGTEIRYHLALGGGAWGDPYVLDLRRGDPAALLGEISIDPDVRSVMWDADTATNFGYTDTLPAGQLYDIDVYEAPLLGDVPEPPVHLPRDVNSPYLETGVSASADGRTVYFASNRPGGLGGLDLWVVARDGGGVWGVAQPLPAPYSSTADERQAVLSPDGTWLYFTSNRAGGDEIWRALASGGSAAELVVSPDAAAAAFSADGTFYFVASRHEAGVLLDADVYFAAPL